jgi:uncharacterized protein YjdB
MKRTLLGVLLYVGVFFLLLSLTACSGGSASFPQDSPNEALTTTTTGTGPALSSIEVSTELENMVVGERQKITVTAKYADGSSKKVTDLCDYFKSSNETMAYVSARGVVTAYAPGTVTITVSYTQNGVTRTMVFTLDVLPDIMNG